MGITSEETTLKNLNSKDLARNMSQEFELSSMNVLNYNITSLKIKKKEEEAEIDLSLVGVNVPDLQKIKKQKFPILLLFCSNRHRSIVGRGGCGAIIAKW